MSHSHTDTPLTLYQAHAHIAESIGRAHAARAQHGHGSDLLQAARIGLWRACLRWDPSLAGGDFRAFAIQRIRWAVTDGWRDLDHLGTHHRRAVKRGDAPPVTVTAADWLDPDSHAPDPADLVADRIDATDALWQLACIPHPYRTVFARYAINGEPLADLAAEFGKSAAWGYMVRRKVAAELRARLTSQAQSVQ